MSTTRNSRQQIKHAKENGLVLVRAQFDFSHLKERPDNDLSQLGTMAFTGAVNLACAKGMVEAYEARGLRLTPAEEMVMLLLRGRGATTVRDIQAQFGFKIDQCRKIHKIYLELYLRERSASREHQE
jgi:hypothetical protein